MNGILDQIRFPGQFSPTSVEQYIALQLSKRLSDESAVMRYVHYIGRHTVEYVLHLFQEVSKEPDPARAFHSFLNPPDS